MKFEKRLSRRVFSKDGREVVKILVDERSDGHWIVVVVHDPDVPVMVRSIPFQPIHLALCECGCGEEVSKDGNRFIVGHHGRRIPSRPIVTPPTP